MIIKFKKRIASVKNENSNTLNLIIMKRDAMDCGATCLRMVAKLYGRNYSLDSLRNKIYITSEGASLLGLSEAAGSIGFKTLGIRASFKLLCETPLPCIVHWRQTHFVVVYDIKYL